MESDTLTIGGIVFLICSYALHRCVSQMDKANDGFSENIVKLWETINDCRNEITELKSKCREFEREIFKNSKDDTKV